MTPLPQPASRDPRGAVSAAASEATRLAPLDPRGERLTCETRDRPPGNTAELGGGRFGRIR